MVGGVTMHEELRDAASRKLRTIYLDCRSSPQSSVKTHLKDSSFMARKGGVRVSFTVPRTTGVPAKKVS